DEDVDAMSFTTWGSQLGLSRFSVASARIRARRCSGDSGHCPASAVTMLSCGGGRSVVGSAGFTSSGRGVYSEDLRLGFNENMLLRSEVNCSFAVTPVP